MEKNTLETLLQMGDHKVKGYNNRIVDILIPREVLSPLIPVLLKEDTAENLEIVLRINQTIKSYLIYISSNIESLIDTWVHIMVRNNIYFKKKIDELDDKLIKKFITGSNNKTKKLNNIKINRKKSIYELIVRGTLGTKIKILNCINTSNLEWFLKNKRGKANMKSVEEFLQNLDTCLHLRNAITHSSFNVDSGFWTKIYKKTINVRINANLENKKTKIMVREIFADLSTILNKAGYNNIQQRLINHIKRDIFNNNDEDFKKSINNLEISHLY